jgi:nitrous oxide reductase accessory protein NosL
MVSRENVWKARRLAARSILSNIAPVSDKRHHPSMRRLILATTLFLAGCATAPEQPQPVTPEQPQEAQPVQRQTTRLTGMTQRDLVGYFGNPALQVPEGRSMKLQFRSSFCVLDAYLYPGQNGVLRVTYVNTRTPSGADTDQAACISALGLAS